MRVISWKQLGHFAKRHSDAEQPLKAWFKLLETCKASNLTELKSTFGSVDYVSINKREIYVFNVGGNKYRVVVEIKFKWQIAFVQCALTHSEYSTGEWKKAL
jgi:mRNA interferase HigB